MMAGKARLLSDIIGKALNEDDGRDENSSLRQQKLAFQKILIHDITAEGFADVYAQTIAYGMFAHVCTIHPCQHSAAKRRS